MSEDDVWVERALSLFRAALMRSGANPASTYAVSNLVQRCARRGLIEFAAAHGPDDPPGYLLCGVIEVLCANVLIARTHRESPHLTADDVYQRVVEIIDKCYSHVSALPREEVVPSKDAETCEYGAYLRNKARSAGGDELRCKPATHDGNKHRDDD